MQKKKLWIGIIAIVLVSAAAAGLCLHNWHELAQIRTEKLEELERNIGQYDEQRIVLTDTSRRKASELAALYGARLRITSDGHFATLTLPEGTTIRDVYASDDCLPHIDQMAADYQVKISDLPEAGETDTRLPQRPTYTVSDTDYELQGYLDYLNLGNTWHYQSGSGITVAIIDSGIDTDHPEFAGRISDYSYNATEDKIVRDYSDWSLIEDEQGHGTAVAGVLAASMNSGNVIGIAPDVEILVIKANCDENGAFERLSDLIFGLYYAIERDAEVINMSFGCQAQDNPFEAATQLAYDSDIICIAAAGNSATSALTWPAADPLVIGVGALDGWNLASYSNYGENTNIMAPGTTYTTTMGGRYETKTGTSMASPIVAGAVALHLSQNPWRTFDEVTEVLYASGYDLGTPGRDWYYGFGALDIDAFVNQYPSTVTYDMLTDEVDDLQGVFLPGIPLQELPEPERLYAVFDGWYYDPTCTQEVDYFSDAFYSSITLYAKWINEDDGVPYTYAQLPDGTIQITGYTGHRRYITIPEKIDGMTVSSIGPQAFKNGMKLREINLPSGLTEICEEAFSGCSNLLRIHIPEKVTIIGASAFVDNVRLSDVTFAGNRLTEIGAFAFAACGKLETIELPASLTKIDGSAFFGNTALYSIRVQAGNPSFVSKDGVLFSKAKDTLISFPAAKSAHYTIPQGTTTIGCYAFACSGLTAIDLEGIRTLEEAAFLNSLSLAELNLGNTLTLIPKEAFGGCAALQQLTVPSGITELGLACFSASGLRQVTFAENSRLTTIGSGAFYNCSLSEIDIPASVITISGSAFSGLNAGNPLVRVSFPTDSKLQTIGERAFQKCFLLQKIQLPATLKNIGSFAFRESALTEITVPATVTELGDGAFAQCANLPAIQIAAGNPVYHDIDGVVYTLDNTVIHTYPAGSSRTDYAPETTVKTIAPWAFSGTESLIHIYLPEGLTQISEYAFAYSASLQHLSIPDNVLQIGRYAFAHAQTLYSVSFSPNAKLPRLSFGAFAYSNLSSLEIPASVATMAQGVFLGCRNLSQITFAPNSKLESISAHLFDGCEQLYSIVFREGSALTDIQAHGLEGMASLSSIDFGDAKLTNIDNFAFRFCENLTGLTIPETVTNIGRYAFYRCGNLTELTIPAQVEHIGSYAFLGTKDLNVYFTAETMPGSLDENWDQSIRGYYNGVSAIAETEEYRYAVMTSGDIAILEYLGNASSVDLTKVNLGGDITIIGGSSFEDAPIHAIVLPETLTAIQAEAFQNSALRSVTIPRKVTFIGREAFAHTALSSLTFSSGSSVNVIEQYAFRGTKSLTAVTIPASVTTMGTGVFQESGLTGVTFANGIQLTRIPQNAFTGTKLSAVTLPDSVTVVDHHAFSNITTLKKLSFGNAESIQLMSSAFYNTGLDRLVIPANVTYIGEYCFVGLNDLLVFEVDLANPNYTAVEGLLLSKDQRKLIAVPAGRTGKLTVPKTVETIGFGAFEESKLTTVRFYEDANILTFGYRAFFNSAITEITIPASIVSIDYYAFAYCEDLERVTFADGNSLKGIYEGAFCGDVNLRNIELPDSIVEISDFAFYGCTTIDKVPVSKTSTVKGIYDYAFAYTGIQGEFSPPETLIDIGNYAFMGTDITELTISDTNKKDLIIGIGAFAECNRLAEITLPFVGESLDNTQIGWFGYIFGAGTHESNNLFLPESLETVTITEGITTLGPGAFYEVDTPGVLNLPKSLSAIYEYAFCNTGAKFQLPGAVSLVDSRGEMFFGTWFAESNLCGNVTLAEGTVTIPGFAFNNCRMLQTVTIPDSVTTIKDSAFQGAGLTSVTLPASVTTIEEYAFNGCSSLLKVVNLTALSILPGDSGNGHVAEYALMVIDSQGNIVSVEDGITRVETEDGFVFELQEGQYTLVAYTGDQTTVTLPTQINGQSYRIFRLKGAYNVIIPGELGKVNTDAFSDGSDVKNVILSEGITEIENMAFYYSTNLRSITLPESLTSIRAGAFTGCWKLESIHIPKNVTLIETPFEGCTILEVTIDSENTHYVEHNGVIYNAAMTEMIHASPSLTEITIPNTVNSFSLANHFNLQSVTFEEGSCLTYLTGNCFLNCTSLETLVLPDSIEYMGGWVFQDCKQLKEVNLPASLVSLQTNPFSNSYVEQLIIPEGHTAFKLVDGVLYDANMTRLIGALIGVTKVTIPETVTEIATGAFGRNQTLSDVIIGEGITCIPAHTFGEVSLNSLTLPSGLKEIEYWGAPNVKYVYNNSDLELTFGSEDHGGVASNAVCIVDKNGNATYNLPEGSITTEDGFVFEYRDAQYYLISYVGGEDTVTLPLTINGESYQLYQMTGVRNVIIPEGFTEVHNLAFLYCSTLENVVIPNTVTYLSGGAFQCCTSLKSIVIPDSVEALGGSTFSGCTNLRSITMPDSVRLGEYDFDGTAYVRDPANWENGGCYLNNMLIAVDPSLTSFTVREGVTNASDSAFYGAYLLDYLDLGDLNNVNLRDSMNLKTLVLNAAPYYSIANFFVYNDLGLPLTLENIIISEEVVNSNLVFDSIANRNIFVTATENATRWNDNFPGWMQENRVSYAGDWIYARFYDHEGQLFSFSPVRTSQVIRRPVPQLKGYRFLGWDLNGDGIADSIPATSAIDLTAYALVEKICDHTYGSTETIAPDCRKEGRITHTCTSCGHSYSQILPITAHSYAGDNCSVCGQRNPASGKVIASGWSGDLTWKLYETGSLIFSGNGKMKNYTTKTQMPWYSYLDQIKSVILSDGVTSIGTYAFYGAPNLKSIQIADTVTSIGDYAFKNAVKLDNVVLPKQLAQLGDSAFYACSSLSHIEIPASLWTIKPYTFKNCVNLKSVKFNEGNLQKISDGAFYGTGLTALVLPDCLDILDVYAFKNCSALASITIGSGLTELREAVFYGTAITTIEIPEGIKKIGPYAFKNCVNLQTVSLPDTLTTIGEAAFYANTALELLVIPDKVTAIGNYAFRKCAALKFVTFGSDLVTIGECSFYGCTGLTNLVIPDNVTTIKPYAFKTCTGLTSVTLGKKVSTIGEGAFNTCTGLKTIEFPASLTTIGDYCFSGSTNLWKMTFYGNAPSIGTGAFKGLNASAYYPSGNSTWTAAVCQNYGGKLTWKAN